MFDTVTANTKIYSAYFEGDGSGLSNISVSQIIESI